MLPLRSDESEADAGGARGLGPMNPEPLLRAEDVGDGRAPEPGTAAIFDVRRMYPGTDDLGVMGKVMLEACGGMMLPLLLVLARIGVAGPACPPAPGFPLPALKLGWDIVAQVCDVERERQWEKEKSHEVTAMHCIWSSPLKRRVSRARAAFDAPPSLLLAIVRGGLLAWAGSKAASHRHSGSNSVFSQRPRCTFGVALLDCTFELYK